MVALQTGWKVKGIYNEACAAEGHCPYYFGRDVEGGCRYFMVFRIQEGRVNDVDLGGVTVVYNADVPHSKFEDFMAKGSEGGVYISETATPAQREVLDPLVRNNIGALFMKKILGIKYVKIETEETGDTFHIKTPFGQMKQQQMKGFDGGPVRIENTPFPVLQNLKHCHTPYWNYEDYGIKFDYKDRCGTWADFVFEG